MITENKSPVSKRLDNLQAYINDANQDTGNKKSYPVAKWQPSEFGEMDLTIKANGEWWHEGSKMTRQSLIDLFASLLWIEQSNENKSYYLRTPVEQLQITVEDAPLLIVDVNLLKNGSCLVDELADAQSDNQNDYLLQFTTSTQDKVIVDEAHQVYFASYQGESRPYIAVRDGLHALISRSVFYHLLEIGELVEQGEQTLLHLNSGGKVYASSFVEYQ